MCVRARLQIEEEVVRWANAKLRDTARPTPDPSTTPTTTATPPVRLSGLTDPLLANPQVGVTR